MEASTNRAVKDPMNLVISGCQDPGEDEEDLNIIVNTTPQPVIEVVNVYEEGGVGKETKHRSWDETTCDVRSGLSHKMYNHLID